MHSRENHSDHERQLAKIISQGVSLHDWLDEDSEEQLNDEEINEFVRINRAKNTVKKTKGDLRRWRDWPVHYYWRKVRHFGHIPTKELNSIVIFFVKATSHSGKEYFELPTCTYCIETLSIIICMCHAYGNKSLILLVSMQYRI